MEHWHPNPDFFYQPGRRGRSSIWGRIISPAWCNWPGRCCASPHSPRSRPRNARSPSEPRRGQTIDVATPTTVHALLEFANGAVVTVKCQLDVWSHGHSPLEIYGEEGSLFLPDPNFFGGEVRLNRKAEPAPLPEAWEHALAVPNQDHGGRQLANYRTVGLADMAMSIMADRPHRARPSWRCMFVDIMTGMLRFGRERPFRGPCARRANGRRHCRRKKRLI